MKSLSLYEMSDQYQFLVNDLYDHETGVVNETTLARLNELTDTVENKAINITMLFNSLDATREAIKKEKDKMAAREKALASQIERLKEYLLTNMKRCEIKKIECPQFVIGLQNNPISVEISNAEEIPSRYDKQPKRELDITRIKDDLKKGVVIPGASLVQRQSIRIR